MKKKPLNSSLGAAKATKQDEFYTQLSDIEKELRHYTKHFKGKTVLCNCDDPRVSNFFHYFAPQGMAGFVLANGSMSSNQSGRGKVRGRQKPKQFVESGAEVYTKA
jgi:hypothetical protein